MINSDANKALPRILKLSQRVDWRSYNDIFRSRQLNIDDLAKRVAAMANTVGGIIYIGIQVKKTQVVTFEPIPEACPTPQELAHQINQLIEPPISNLNLYFIDSTLVVEVPQSPIRPHQSDNYRYYKRVGTKIMGMEEFEIRNLYFESQQSKLQIVGITNLQGIPMMSGGFFEQLKFYPRIHIQNMGGQLERFYKVEIGIPSALVDETFTVLHKYLKGYEKDKNIYAIKGEDPLFQGEYKTLIELVIKLDNSNYQVFIESEIEINLYSSRQVHRQTYACSEWFHYQGQIPLQSAFVKKLTE